MSDYKPYPVLAVADYLIQLAIDKGNPLTLMKLQKLLFIAHGWNLAFNKQPLIKEPCIAMQWGPAWPSVYDHYAHYWGSNPITVAGIPERKPCISLWQRIKTAWNRRDGEEG